MMCQQAKGAVWTPQQIIRAGSPETFHVSHASLTGTETYLKTSCQLHKRDSLLS